MKPPTIDKQVIRLRAEIALLTGKSPASTDPRYLAQRLAGFRKRKAAGIDVRRKKTGSSVISASMPVAAGVAFDRILAKERCGVSELVLRALASWAASHGYEAEARAMGGEL